MIADFQREYAELTDDELLQLAADRELDDATSALDAEMRNRDLKPGDLAEHEKFMKRSRQREARRRNRRLFGSRRGLLAWVRFVLWAVLVLAATAAVALWLAARKAF